eukprot:2471999-Rhodomonas_salina.1
MVTRERPPGEGTRSSEHDEGGSEVGGEIAWEVEHGGKGQREMGARETFFQRALGMHLRRVRTEEIELSKSFGRRLPPGVSVQPLACSSTFSITSVLPPADIVGYRVLALKTGI